MKRSIIVVIALLLSIPGTTQDLKTFKLYNPSENAEQKLAELVNQAKSDGKNVFVQIGGNWCIWCARFHNLVTTEPSIDSVLKANYLVYHLNYSKENKNESLLAKYGYPQRFGFPVFLVLNGKGELIHTQNSVYLEEGKGYNIKTIIGFLNDWTPAALDPKKYLEQ